MSDWIKRSIAQWLHPKAFEEAEAYSRLKARMGEAYWWLGEFPDAAVALRWALDADFNRNRSIGTLPIGAWPDDISGFREALRRQRALEAQQQEPEA